MLQTVRLDSLLLILGSGDSSVVKRRARVRKVPGSSPGRSGGRFFLSMVTFCTDFCFGIRSTPVLPQ